MTRKLYYEDVYRTTFDAVVIAAKTADGAHWAALSETCFYPEGGGQPGDQGVLFLPQQDPELLEGIPVLDTQEEGGNIWHLLENPLAEGTAVHGMVDWVRRHHWMQQHLGQHILSAISKGQWNAGTVGVHFGAESSTVDLDKLLDSDNVQLLEDMANRQVWLNQTVKTLYPPPEEIEEKARRKPPDTREPIRIVKIGELDYTPCCGTHPESTGEVGLIKILRRESYKGGTRLTFVCGRAALAVFRRAWGEISELQKLLSTGEGELHSRVRQLQEEIYSLKRERLEQQRARTEQQAEQLRLHARQINDYAVVAAVLESGDMEQLKELADALTRPPRCVAMLGAVSPEGEGLLVFRCHRKEQSISVKEPFAAAIRELGGKGGGNDVSAQGISPHTSKSALEATLNAAAQAVAEQMERRF